jgi:hypothetical protein
MCEAEHAHSASFFRIVAFWAVEAAVQGALEALVTAFLNGFFHFMSPRHSECFLGFLDGSQNDLESLGFLCVNAEMFVECRVKGKLRIDAVVELVAGSTEFLECVSVRCWTGMVKEFQSRGAELAE